MHGKLNISYSKENYCQLEQLENLLCNLVTSEGIQ